MVAKAIEVATPLLDQRTHALDVDVPRRLWVRGDAIRLNQVVSNLLTNAAKYTPPGGRIIVRTTEECGEIVIHVRDTGIGIAADMLPRVFDLFVQERQAIDRAQGGLGLGLTIVRNLVERHGGTVSVHSDGPGTGSEFVVRLPRAIVPVEPDVAADVDSACASVIAPSEAALRILVVDDSVDAAEMLAAVLSAKGYRTQVAFDAPAALRIAAEFRPAIAFLDIGLPVMDGYELAARLRDVPELNGIRLFAVTGYGQESDRQQSRNAGFDHHFVKPIDLDAIEAVLSDGTCGLFSHLIIRRKRHQSAASIRVSGRCVRRCHMPPNREHRVPGTSRCHRVAGSRDGGALVPFGVRYRSRRLVRPH